MSRRTRRPAAKGRSSGAATDGTPGPGIARDAGRAGRWRWIVLGGVITLQLVLTAAAFVPAPHSGGDNAGYVSLAYSLLHDGSYRDVYDPAGLPHTKYPPVFPLLLAGWIFAGARTWAALKVVPVLSTTLAVVFTFLWVERRRGPWMAAGVALALSVSSSVIYYSHWILSDPTFLALTMGSLWLLDRGDREGEGGRSVARGAVAGMALAGLAYFTRSAGLPLLVAVAAWLVLRRRWRSLALFVAVMAVPVLLWWLRARGVADAPGAYGSEFLLVDPYRPELGRVGVVGLLARVLRNAWGYVSLHLPGGVVGKGVGRTPAGVILAAAGVVGWARELRRSVRPAELFLPLYVGLILLWPEVWSGDRFALPLYPLLFYYAAVAAVDLTRRFGPWAPRVAGGAALAVVLLPGLQAWNASVREASACRVRVRAAGAMACYGPRFAQFAAAAAWSGAHLPSGSSVWTRKPRLFFVLSGVPSRTYPFEDDADVLLRESDRLGTRYALLDRIDNLGTRYLGGAVRRRPGAFCSVAGFGEGGVGRSELLGILPPAERDAAVPESPGGVAIARCGAGYVRAGLGARDQPSASTSLRIPLLEPPGS